MAFLILFSIPEMVSAGQTIFSASTQSNSLDNGNEAARSAAMGSAFTGVADDASALFSNPAGLGFLGQGQLFLNSDLWLVGTFQETALAGLPTGGAGGFGLAAQYLDYGSMEGRDSVGSLTANYSANRLGLQAGWGYEILRHLSLGVGLSGLQTTLAGTGYTSFSSNLGILWKGPGGIRVGASYVNTGWVSPGGASEDAVNLGVSYELTLDSANHLLAAVAGSLEPNAVNYLQAGAEYSIRDQVFLRLGCQVPLSDQALGGFTDLTAGVGFHLSGFSLDYAFLPYGDLGAAHRVSVGYFWGGTKPERSSSGKKTAPGGLKTGVFNSNGSTVKNITATSPAYSLKPLPPLNTAPGGTSLPLPPAQPGLPGTGTGTSAATTGTAPQAASPDQAKDSLVVQFDLPDNAAPNGADLEKEGKYKEALLAYRAAVQQNPQDPSAWWALANYYREQRQKDYAVQCFERVLKLQPGNQKLSNWLQQYKASNP